MSQKITRKGSTARRTAASQGKARKVRQARARTGSALDAVIDWLPISEAALHRVFMAAILGGAVALAWIAASMAGLPTLASQQLGMVAADAGFQVRRVDVRGVENLNELKVYERALAQRDQAMPQVDIEALRDQLLELSWVKDARVSRQLPDTLVIDIVEREPHAVLRKNDRLVLIDETGHELEPVSAERARWRLMVSGQGAGRQVKELSALLEAAPALKPQVREAQWVGNRRWNLTFKTDQVLALPEGSKDAAAALVSFARLDGTNRLIGGKVVAFDMRAGDRIYLRVPGRDPQSAAINSASVAKQQEAQ
jgi:cell division protein FtsQ